MQLIAFRINQSIYKSDLTDCYKEREREIPQKKLLICHKTDWHENLYGQCELKRRGLMRNQSNSTVLLWLLCRWGLLTVFSHLSGPFLTREVTLAVAKWVKRASLRSPERVWHWMVSKTSNLLEVLKYLQHTVPSCLLTSLILRFYLSRSLTFTRAAHENPSVK